MAMGDRTGESTATRSRRELAADAREDEADRREAASDIREGVLDRWERELTSRALALDVLDDADRGALEAARRQRAEARRRRRIDAEARRDAAVQRGIENAERADPEAIADSSLDMSHSRALERLAAIVDGSATVTETLDAILALATEAFPDAGAAAITLVVHGQTEPAASTNAWAHELDAAQSSLARGPIADAVENGTIVVSSDLGADRRWHLADSIGAGAHRGVLSAPIIVGDEPAAVLTIYGATTGGFLRHETLNAAMLAAQASLAVGWSLDRASQSAQAEAWERALASRDEIGQAKGVLMAQLDLTAEAAFELLRTTSQRHNAKVRDIARHVTLHRRLPDPGDC
jgi:hypothetical protein